MVVEGDMGSMGGERKEGDAMSERHAVEYLWDVRGTAGWKCHQCGKAVECIRADGTAPLCSDCAAREIGRNIGRSHRQQFDAEVFRILDATNIPGDAS